MDCLENYKIPSKEQYFTFFTQETTPGRKMTSSKVQKVCERFKLPFGYFNGREIVPNKKNLNTKTASGRRRTLYQFPNDH